MIKLPRIVESTGDIALDLLACAWAAAFEEAEDDVAPRAELLTMFEPETLHRLHRLRLIKWDPDTVPMQMEMGVAL